MKFLTNSFCAIFLCGALQTLAQCTMPTPSTPTYPTLTDELTGQPISSSSTKCVVLTHGWNPGGANDCYDINHGFEWFNLLENLKLALKGSGWNIIAYDWHTDANTGLIGNPIADGSPEFLFTHANQAAVNAQLDGDHLASQLNTLAPNLREVHFIAHSAGSWAARKRPKDYCS